ncbi:hypothetical protein [Pseudochrobactrum asaccharolyticum]|uniref:hypothetical protein n=1 Tax=Pseudochrobactrum asaccharolyticum TaxID=354351 RepID=UPI0040435E4A
MVDKVIWDDLLEIYKNTTWGADNQSQIRIANDYIRNTLQVIDDEESEGLRTGITIPNGLDGIDVGDDVTAIIGRPQASIGLLVDDWDSFLRRTAVYLDEPKAYFIKEDSSYTADENTSHNQAGYRAVLSLLKICMDAALVTDANNGRIVFHSGNRVDLPLHLTSKGIQGVDIGSIGELNKCLEEPVHKEQKLQILSEAIIELISPIKTNERLAYLVLSVKEILQRVNGGYQIFVSSFSYNKIRNEVATAQSDYVSKIHKTFTDIQGQILGLPVAAIVVASQLKAAPECGPDIWGNIAILAGAWVFVVLLIMSCVNQWLTLNAISEEIRRQINRLQSDYSEISEQFSSAYTNLNNRICWHRFGLAIIITLGVAGAIIATCAFYYVLPSSSVINCITRSEQAASPAIWAALSSF